MAEPSVDPTVAAALAGLAARLDSLEERQRQGAALATDRFDHTLEILWRIFDREQDDRRRLAALRASDGYEAAFTEPAPLVSVVIPTFDRVDSLIELALPSVLAQTHPTVEVIVVGDHAPAAMSAALAGLGDPRVRYENLTLRGPYADDPLSAWRASGTPALNAGFRLAQGRWIAPFNDDDAMAPDALATLVARAQADRLEWVYGKLRVTTPDAVSELGSFPPRVTVQGLQSPMQASVLHAGLRFIELELAHALFGVTNDVGLTRRLCLAGVRVGFVDQVVADYFPSMRGSAASAARAAQAAAAPTTAADAGLRAERDQLAASLTAAHTELAARRRSEAELVGTLDTLLASRRWRWGEALRRRLGSTRSRGVTAAFSRRQRGRPGRPPGERLLD